MRGYRFSDIGLAVEAWFLPLGAYLSVTLEVKQGSSTDVPRPQGTECSRTVRIQEMCGVGSRVLYLLESCIYLPDV